MLRGVWGVGAGGAGDAQTHTYIHTLTSQGSPWDGSKVGHIAEYCGGRGGVWGFGTSCSLVSRDDGRMFFCCSQFSLTQRQCGCSCYLTPIKSHINFLMLKHLLHGCSLMLDSILVSIAFTMISVFFPQALT